MEISGIRSSLPFLFPGANQDGTQATGSKDIVNVNIPELIPDEEVENVFQDTLAMIAQDGAKALGIHSSLSESRVFALIGA